MSSRKRARLNVSIPELTFLTNDNILRVSSVSADGRRTNERHIPFKPIPPSPTKTSTKAQVENFAGLQECSITNGDFTMADDDEYLENGRRRWEAADNPLDDFKPRAFEYLEELLCVEGRGGVDTLCLCGSRDGVAYRCQDCSEARMSCKTCVLGQHGCRLFHFIEKWNGSFFKRTTLKSLGLKLQLGHPNGHICVMPRQARSGFVVVDIDSLQEVDVYFCMCQPQEVVGDHWQQLMRYELFPATSTQPHTAFTFRLLRFFHTLTLQGKINIYDYYILIENRMDGAKIAPQKDRYEAFRRVVREWRYLKMLKRGGAGIKFHSLVDIQRGELAPRCPACPIPGVNLPDDWQLAPASKSFIYRKFISVDVCFRLKRRKISSEQSDPGLATGLAYFVPQDQYQPFQKAVGDQKETDRCTGGRLAAIEQANVKFNKGYATTGVVLCLCARHEVVEPNGAVDLDKGEKYALTDYAISASQSLSDKSLFRVLSYNIACQYRKNFFNRLPNLPEAIRIDTDKKLWTFAVPKLHIRGHGLDCQQNFSLHLLRGVGQSDGEGSERHWGNEGPIATSTQEMGPGHRRDTIDDHFLSWTHRKRVGLGHFLLIRRKAAVKQERIHAQEFLKLSKSQAPSVEEWTKMVDNWENGVSEENPYILPDIGSTKEEVRLRFAEEEAEQAHLGVLALHEVSPSAFMQLGLELEEAQRVLALDVASENWNTAKQKTELITRRAQIQRSIGRLRTLQHIYTPLALSSATSTHETTDVVKSESIPLMLPSSLDPKVLSQPEMTSWVDMELQFRRGQMRSSIHEVHVCLSIRSRLHRKHAFDTCGQKESKKAREKMAKNDGLLEEAALKFRAAWSATKVLLGGREDLVGYPYLKDSDIRMIEEPDMTTTGNKRRVKGSQFREYETALLVEGESRKTTSWLWNLFDSSEDSKAIQEATRVEWMKARARDLRWKEELELINEEMRRTLLTLEYEAQEWVSWVAKENDSRPEGEGVTAYALRQAAIRRGLARKFQVLWNEDRDSGDLLDGPCQTSFSDDKSDDEE
ncbi:hypothetical protein VNI00_014900 [Paramarasmius palmivorus]|uniref:CxC2-like cysteine cluster KDZ transposase-associated domain-containing protein n=1 Tax=Paramarasmius palmivorus TaxID=297713 RepID=A0AAW0BR26_9AGAR